MFIVVPVGHDQRLYGRLWATWAIIAICVIAFALTWWMRRDAEMRLDAVAARVDAIVLEHPGARVDAKLIADLPPAYHEIVAGLTTTDRDELENEGGLELRRATRDLVAAVQSMPSMRFGYRPARPSVLAVLTSPFVHADLGHLAGNLIFLWVAASVIECFWEHTRFVVLYLVAGVAGIAAHHAASPDSLVPLVGASGAIAGLMGAFLVGHPRARVRLFIAAWVGRPFVGATYVPVWVVVPGWIAMQIAFAFLSPGDGTAYWAHVGGFAVGVAGALIARWRGWAYEDADLALRATKPSPSSPA